MNITVINGTEKHGVTYRLKEMFLVEFKDKANITEYYLPKDCPSFCTGCLNCILMGEHTCKEAEKQVELTGKVKNLSKKFAHIDYTRSATPT